MWSVDGLVLLSRVLKVGSKYQVGLTRDLRLGYDRLPPMHDDRGGCDVC